MRAIPQIQNLSNAKKNSASGNLFFQPRLTINEPDDIYEKEADTMADKVMRMKGPSLKQNFFAPAIQRKCDKCEEAEKNKIQKKPVPLMIQREDGDKKPDDKKTDEKKEDVSVGFIDLKSLEDALKDLFKKLPDRYKDAYQTYKKAHDTFNPDLSESRKLASKEIMALWNLSNALVYKFGYSNYKDVGISDSIKIAESLSGVTDTWITLASLAFQKDMDKYISDEVPALVKKNLGAIILTGLLIQGGITAVQYGRTGEADFLSLASPILSSYTAPPVGLTNPLQLDNIADKRWKSPFSKPEPGLDVSWTEQAKDPNTPRTLNVNFGINVASALSLYPKKEEDKKKYKGWEAYPFFNFTRSYAQQTATGAEQQDKYFGGFFVGNEGFYVLMEAGKITGPLGDIESYKKGGFVLKNIGNLKLLSLDTEADEKGDVTRERINAATQIQLVDSNKWQFVLGGTVGGLLKTDKAPGSVDYGASLSLNYKDSSAAKTGVDVGFSTRTQDPFDATSKQLFTFKAGLVFKDIVTLGLQYDKISGPGPVNTFPSLPPGLDLPQNDLKLYVGVNILPLILKDEKKK